MEKSGLRHTVLPALPPRLGGKTGAWRRSPSCSALSWESPSTVGPHAHAPARTQASVHICSHTHRRACAGVMCKFPLLSFRVPGPGSPSQSRPGVEKLGQDVLTGQKATQELSGRWLATLLFPGRQDTRCSPTEACGHGAGPGLSPVHPRGWASGAGPVTLSSGPIGPIPPQNKQPRGRDRPPEGGPLPPLSGPRGCPQLQASPGAQVPPFPTPPA